MDVVWKPADKHWKVIELCTVKFAAEGALDGEVPLVNHGDKDL